MKPNSKLLAVAASLLSIMAWTAVPAFAQLNGENLLGDNGVKSGSQAAPGTYLGFLYYRYGSDSIKNQDGSDLALNPADPGSMALHAALPLVLYVSKAKLFGANYGAMFALPTANGSLEAPGFGFQSDIGTGLADAYFVPLQLGWHFKRADVISSAAFFAPTGRYTAGATDNVGKGMWSYEFSGGTTFYADEKKSISIATTAYWELHSRKSGTADVNIDHVQLTNAKVGQLLTLEGGVAKSFLEGAASIGMAYYAQFKLTQDEFGFRVQPPAGAIVGKHRVFGLGPDVTIPIATKTKLISLVNVRYFWEADARVKTQGQSLVLAAMFPIPSIKIPTK